MLTRYEASRIIGLRALQLSHGAEALVECQPTHRCDFYYIAARELSERKLDMQVDRDGVRMHVSALHLPNSVNVLLDTKDGGSRSFHTGRSLYP